MHCGTVHCAGIASAAVEVCKAANKCLKKLTMIIAALVDIANIVIARVVVADVVGPSVEVPVSHAHSIIRDNVYARTRLLVSIVTKRWAWNFRTSWGGTGCTGWH